MITADTITDEQIRGLQRSVDGRTFPAAGMAHTELSEIYETCTLALYGGTWDPPSPRHDARARCAEILNARAANASALTCCSVNHAAAQGLGRHLREVHGPAERTIEAAYRDTFGVKPDREFVREAAAKLLAPEVRS